MNRRHWTNSFRSDWRMPKQRLAGFAPPQATFPLASLCDATLRRLMPYMITSTIPQWSAESRLPNLRYRPCLTTSLLVREVDFESPLL